MHINYLLKIQIIQTCNDIFYKTQEAFCPHLIEEKKLCFQDRNYKTGRFQDFKLNLKS